MKQFGCTLLSIVAITASTILHAQPYRSTSSVVPQAQPSSIVPSRQIPIVASVAPSLSPEQQQKVGSGLLFQHALTKHAAARTAELGAAAGASLTVAIYQPQYPSIADLDALEHLGVRCTPESWIPPMEHHPLGFFLAQVPVDRIADVLSLPSVRKMDSAEGESVPMNNTAAIASKATLAWTAGWTGTGVKVGVIDSGLDYTLPKTELPDSMWYRNYAFYPDSVNNNVRNSVTGHGTHVTGSVLGKGGYSASPVLNAGNGGGAYKGMAPDAKLVFLKIGKVTTSGATSAAMVAAIKSAVDTFHVRLINMSYGGWDAYHDGSNAESQATDYAYSNGVACFYSAGNEAASGRHYSGTVAAGSTTSDIMITVSASSNGSNTALWFNLVWADGAARNNLSMSYFDAAHNPLGSIIQSPTTESPRGTESKYSHYNIYVPAGAGTFYVRVTNPSASPQFFHIYDDWGNGVVRFASPDPGYTVTSPALADHACAVAAYVTRSGWTDHSGSSWTFGYATNGIAPFSSRGPRVDGLQKPNISAPGSALISLRDRDVYTAADAYWIDNDGTAGGDANYYVMQGTSMASPVTAGCAALLAQQAPASSPQQIYNAITQSAVVDANTGAAPNATWGYGKLDVNGALADPALPVELASFTSTVRTGAIALSWSTATETNNYGFEIERKVVARTLAISGAPMTADAAWTKIGFVPGQGTSQSVHTYAFTDASPVSGRVSYRLKQIDRNGQSQYSAEIEAASDAAAPLKYELAQNYPNPFNPTTAIRFSVAKAGQVRLTIFDVLGRRTAELVNERLEPGSYTTEWDARGVSSGVYFYRIDAGSFSAVRKLLVQK